MERSMLESVILSYYLHVKNKTIPTRLNWAIKTESLIDFIITNCSLTNDTVFCDSIVKIENLATLSMFGLRVENKMVPVLKTF